MPNNIFDAIYHDYPDITEQCQHWIKSFQYPQLQTSLTYVPPTADNAQSDTSPNNNNNNNQNKTTVETAQTKSNHQSSLAKQRQAVGSGFFNESTKFTGSRMSGQPLHVVKRRFKELIFEQEIPESQTVQLIHNCVSGVSNGYFYTCVRDATNNMDEAFKMLEERFSSKQHHSQAITYLKRLTFQGIKNEKSCSDLEALSIANDRILRQVPQCGPSYQGEHQDGHKTQFLADIVDSESWAQGVLATRITSSDRNGNEMDYDRFYSMLTSALTLMENRKNDGDVSETLYGAQFGRPPFRPQRQNRFNNNYRKPGNRFNNNYRKPGSNIRDARSKNRCFICKQPGHWKNECPNRPVSMTEIIKARVKEEGGSNRAAASVLFCLAQEEDNYQEYVDSTEPDEQENTFETLINQVYDTEEAQADLENTFDELVNGETEQSQGFQ